MISAEVRVTLVAQTFEMVRDTGVVEVGDGVNVGAMQQVGVGVGEEVEGNVMKV